MFVGGKQGGAGRGGHTNLMNTPSRRRMEQDNTRPEQPRFASHLPSISPLPRQNNSLYCNTVYNLSRWSYYPRGTRERLSLQRRHFAAHRNVFVCLQVRLTVCILNLSLPPLPNHLLWMSVLSHRFKENALAQSKVPARPQEAVDIRHLSV